MRTAVAVSKVDGIDIRPCVGDGRGNVTSVGVPDALAEFFGVYRKGEDGLWEHVENFSSRKHAATFVLALREN